MVSVDNDLRSSYFSLFFSIHNMIRIYSIRTTSMIWIIWYLIQIVYSLAILIYHNLIVCIVLTTETCLILWIYSSLFLAFGYVTWAWSWNLVTLNILLLLLVARLLKLYVTLACVFDCASLFCFVVFTLLVLSCVLEVLLLKCNAVIIQNYLFVRTASWIVFRCP